MRKLNSFFLSIHIKETKEESIIQSHADQKFNDSIIIREAIRVLKNRKNRNIDRKNLLFIKDFGNNCCC